MPEGPRCRCCGSTKGQIEFHHPVSTKHALGLNLCQRCHSILQGRKKWYASELGHDTPLESQRLDMLAWVADQLGIPIDQVDKA